MPEEISQFRDEIKHHAHVTGLGSIPLVISAEFAKQPWLLMEYIDGTSITEHCDSCCLSIANRLHLFLKVCDAVEAIHRSDLVHGDLKPANVLITDDGQPVLIDFGSVVEASSQSRETTRREKKRRESYTPEYASPEQIRRLALTPASDVYALGVMLFRILTGSMPFRFPSVTLQTEVEQIVLHDQPLLFAEVLASTSDSELSKLLTSRRLASRKSFLRQLDPALNSIINKALSRADLNEPAKLRYPTVTSLASDIRLFLNGYAIPTYRRSFAYLVERWMTRNRAKISAVALASVCGLAAAGITYFQVSKSYTVPTNLAGQFYSYRIDRELFVGLASSDSETVISIDDSNSIVISQQNRALLRIPIRSVDRIQVVGTAGDDKLTIDVRNGSPIPRGGIDFDGLAGEDQMAYLDDDDSNEIVATSDSHGLDVSIGTSRLRLTQTELLNVHGNGGDDVIDCSQVTAKSVTVLLDGGDGSDSLSGGIGNDRLREGAGDDTLAGGIGTNTLRGGTGNDTFMATATSVDEVVDTSGDADTLDYSMLSEDLTVSLSTNAKTPHFRFTGNVSDTIENVVGGSGNDTITGSTADNDLVGGAGHDEINGIGGNNTISGGPGNDTLRGGGDGTDTLSETVSGTIDLDPLKLSGRFVDTLASIEKAILQGSESDDDINVYDFSNAFVDKGVTVIGGGGNDTITGGNGKDLLGGESGDDVIHGNKGSDTLSGGAGSDTINDSAGVDRIVESLATWSPEEAPIRDRIDVVVTAHGMKVTNRNSRVSQVDTWNGDFEIVNINGHNGKNSIDVSAFSEHLAKSEIGWVSADGRIGNDTLIGGLGSDNLIGGSGDDEIRGAAGHDTLSGGPGHDLLIGGPGTDLLHGDDDDDVIVGGSGDDRLYGGAGKDILVANLAQDAGIDSGIDVLDGGTGDDFLFVDANDQPVSGTGVATYQQVTTHSLPKTLINRLELLRAAAMSQKNEELRRG